VPDPVRVDGEVLKLDGLRSLAAGMVASLKKGAVVWLEGELGAGKTTFVQLLVEEAGGLEASSPSFSLVNAYPTKEGEIYHADCYRLRSHEEAVDLDLWGLGERGRILLIEWPLRGGEHVPPPNFVVKLEHVGNPEQRMVSVKEC
jgi:tRNA threonylcarbamoyladenosine biosynthesis protein TsaE